MAVQTKTKGFTLIELMVTVAIISLSLTFVFFRIDTFLPMTRLSASCRKLVADLENIRVASIMIYKQPVHLEYDLENQGYRAYIPFELDEEEQIIGPGETTILEFKALPEGVVFRDIYLGVSHEAIEDVDRITVLVKPDGSVTGHIAHIRDVHYEKEFSMRIASLTGFAEIMDYRVEYEEIDDNQF